MKTDKPSANTPTTARLEDRRVADLAPHPDQPRYAFEDDGPEVEARAEAIRRDGIQTPDDVLPRRNRVGLPADTLLGSDIQARAAARAGLETVPVRVRHDLRRAPRHEVDGVFQMNHRRPMTPLYQCWALLQLAKAEARTLGRRRVGDLAAGGGARYMAAMKLNTSFEEAALYLSALEGPAEVRHALEAGAVPLADAVRVVTLPWDEREELAARLRAGEDAGAVFADFLAPGGVRRAPPDAEVAAIAEAVPARGGFLSSMVVGGGPDGGPRHPDAVWAEAELLRGLLHYLDPV